MAYKYVEFEYPNSVLIQKFLAWIDKNANVYFALKLNSTDDWSYYAGDASHALLPGDLLTAAVDETAAQTNYLTTVRRTADGMIRCILPTNFHAKYARMYVEEGLTVTIHEFRPSVYFVANEIVSGTLEVTDQLSDAPKLLVTADGSTQGVFGNLNGYYGISDNYYGLGLGTSDLSGNYLRYDSNSGDLVIAGDIKTSPTVGTTKGIHLDATNNELYFYGDRGGSVIAKLISMGVNVESDNDYLLLLGADISHICPARIKFGNPASYQTSLRIDYGSESYATPIANYSEVIVIYNHDEVGSCIYGALSGGAPATSKIFRANTQSDSSYAIYVDRGISYLAGYTLAKGGIRVGTTATDPGDNNFYVEGTSDFAGVSTFTNEGLHLLDTNASHDLIIKPGSDLSADRILTITTGDAARTLTLSGNLTVNGTLQLGEAEVNIGTKAENFTVDFSAGKLHKVTLAKVGLTATFTAPAVPLSGLILKIIQDGTGSRTITTWPATVKWAGGVAPTLSTAASSVDIISFYYDGTNYWGTYANGFA